MTEEVQNDSGAANSQSDQLQRVIEEATSGLKRTNIELKTEKTQLKEQLDSLTQQLEGLGGLDTLKQLGGADTVRQLVEMQKRFQADEQGKLLTEGKYDEWFDKRTTALRKDHENQLKNLQIALEEANGKVSKSEGALRKKVLETEVSSACLEVGVEGSAILDVQLRAANTFTFDQERGRVVLRDEDGGIVFGKDGSTPKTIKEWLEDQKETSRHWWPASKGSGADGSGRLGDRPGLDKLDMRSYSEQRKKQGFKSF